MCFDVIRQMEKEDNLTIDQKGGENQLLKSVTFGLKQ